jgi:hypothetical protein
MSQCVNPIHLVRRQRKIDNTDVLVGMRFTPRTRDNYHAVPLIESAQCDLTRCFAVRITNRSKRFIIEDLAAGIWHIGGQRHAMFSDHVEYRPLIDVGVVLNVVRERGMSVAAQASLISVAVKLLTPIFCAKPTRCTALRARTVPPNGRSNFG